MTFIGRILEIDLSTGKWTLSQIPEDRMRDYLGGRGLNIRCLFDNIPPGTDPLGPDNILTISCGLLTERLPRPHPDCISARCHL